MDVFINGDIYDGGAVVKAGLRIRCTPDGGSFYPKGSVAFEIGKVYHLIAEDRSLAIRITQFVVESSRPRTEVRFVTLGPVDRHPANPPPASDAGGDTAVLSAQDQSTELIPAPPSKPA